MSYKATKDRAPFPSALLYWGWQRRRWLEVFGAHGITYFGE